MKPARRPTARTALLKAALAGAGVVFLVLALALPAPWAYAVGAAFLVGSVIVGRLRR